MTNSELEEITTDIKSIREAVYEIENGKNTYARRVKRQEASSLIHDVTEKYKRMKGTNT